MKFIIILYLRSFLPCSRVFASGYQQKLIKLKMFSIRFGRTLSDVVENVGESILVFEYTRRRISISFQISYRIA